MKSPRNGGQLKKRGYMARADHVFVHRLGYTHHGIDVGDGTIIHYTGEIGQKTNALVRQASLEDFAKGCDIHIRAYGTCDGLDVTIERATSRLGETKYHLVFNNCEHFATWCKTGLHASAQVNGVTAACVGVGTAGTAVVSGVSTVGAVGAVAGFSGSGIMSGLATVGSVVGGGAVAGVAIVGIAPAAITSAMLIYGLKDDPIHHDAERNSRRAGRIATLAGAVCGIAGSIGAVGMAGVSGFSAVGITSGLAAVGATLGGGMAAGVVVTAATPAVAAGTIGYATYRLWRRGRMNRGPKGSGQTDGSRSGESAS